MNWMQSWAIRTALVVVALAITWPVFMAAFPWPWNWVFVPFAMVFGPMGLGILVREAGRSLRLRTYA